MRSLGSYLYVIKVPFQIRKGKLRRVCKVSNSCSQFGWASANDEGIEGWRKRDNDWGLMLERVMRMETV